MKQESIYSPMQQVSRALNHALRQQIIGFIRKHEKATVTEIHTALEIDQSIASTNLAILRAIGVVLFKEEGKWHFYTLNEKKLADYNFIAESVKL